MVRKHLKGNFDRDCTVPLCSRVILLLLFPFSHFGEFCIYRYLWKLCTCLTASPSSLSRWAGEDITLVLQLCIFGAFLLKISCSLDYIKFIYQNYFIKCTYKTILVGGDISQLVTYLEHLSSISGIHVYFSFKADMVAHDCNPSAGMGRKLTRGRALPAWWAPGEVDSLS